jgi:hypothetical protein
VENFIGIYKKLIGEKSKEENYYYYYYYYLQRNMIEEEEEYVEVRYEQQDSQKLSHIFI